jgi:hypothetical protein
MKSKRNLQVRMSVKRNRKTKLCAKFSDVVLSYVVPREAWMRFL